MGASRLLMSDPRHEAKQAAKSDCQKRYICLRNEHWWEILGRKSGEPHAHA
jgi:hypothetical protein